MANNFASLVIVTVMVIFAMRPMDLIAFAIITPCPTLILVSDADSLKMMVVIASNALNVWNTTLVPRKKVTNVTGK
jgi:hypothetical protein